MNGLAAETQFHVLAVDDSIIDRKLIERLLKTSSYQGRLNLQIYYFSFSFFIICADFCICHMQLLQWNLELRLLNSWDCLTMKKMMKFQIQIQTQTAKELK